MAPPPLSSAGIGRLYLLHINKKDLERDKEYDELLAACRGTREEGEKAK
jgi:hypothetical protein